MRIGSIPSGGLLIGSSSSNLDQFYTRWRPEKEASTRGFTAALLHKIAAVERWFLPLIRQHRLEEKEEMVRT